MPGKSLMCFLLSCVLVVGVKASILNESHVVAANSTTAGLEPAARTFTIQTAGTYTVTLTDLGNYASSLCQSSSSSASSSTDIPCRMDSLAVVITQGDQLIKQISVSEISGASGVATATITLNAGTYNSQVLGTTSTAGAYTLTIADATTTALSDAGGINAPSSAAVFAETVDLTLTSGQSYSVSMLDFAMPAELDSGSELGIEIDGVLSSCSAVTVASGACTFTAGSKNQLLIYADATSHGAGLVGAKITNAGHTVFASTYPIGSLPAAASIDLAAASNYTLTLTDIQSPAALSSLQSILIEGADVLTTVSAANNTSAPFVATQGTGQLYVMAVPNASAGAGVYFVQLQRAGTGVYSNAVPVTAASNGTADGFSYKFTAGATGSYQLNLTDLAAPYQLGQVWAVLTHDTDKLTTIYGGTTTASVMPSLTAGNEYVLSIVATTGIKNAIAQDFGMYGVSIYGPPTITKFTASQTSIKSGDSVTLTWESSETTSCTAGGGWSGTKATSGSETIGPISSSEDVTLTCAGPLGTSAVQTQHLTIPVVTAGSGGGGHGGGEFSLEFLVALAGFYGLRRRMYQ